MNCAGSKPHYPVSSDRISGDTKKTNGKRDPDNREDLGEESAQIPICATLFGSNCCEALGITARGSAPVLALCRALVAAGHDPRRPLHAGRGHVLALKVRSIGEGAKLAVREDRNGPRFAPWEPFPRRVDARVRQKAEGLGSASDRENEPGVRPGAAEAAPTQTMPIPTSSRAKRRAGRAAGGGEQ
jgi:hypothetical protein